MALQLTIAFQESLQLYFIISFKTSPCFFLPLHPTKYLPLLNVHYLSFIITVNSYTPVFYRLPFSLLIPEQAGLSKKYTVKYLSRI